MDAEHLKRAIVNRSAWLLCGSTARESNEGDRPNLRWPIRAPTAPRTDPRRQNLAAANRKGRRAASSLGLERGTRPIRSRLKLIEFDAIDEIGWDSRAVRALRITWLLIHA